MLESSFHLLSFNVFFYLKTTSIFEEIRYSYMMEYACTFASDKFMQPVQIAVF